MAKFRSKEEWPIFRQTRHGVSLEGSPWKKVTEGSLHYYSEASVRLAATNRNDLEPLGQVRISRSRITVKGRRVFAPFFRAMFFADRGDGKERAQYELGMGRCQTWSDAAAAVSDGLDVVAAIKEHGKRVYDRELWTPVRPFHVRYPWVDPEEPNAKYTSFSLVGPWSIEAGMEGVVHQYCPTVSSMRDLAQRYHANALLVRKSDGAWEVYHRHNMTTGDPIEIEDFYGRILAGQDDDF